MSNAHAFSCLTCSKTFAFAGSLAAHTQVRGHVANPSTSDTPSVTAIPNPRHLCTTCTTPKAFATSQGLRSHVKAKHPLPANDGRSPPTAPSAVVPMSHAQVSRGTASSSAPANAPANAPATATRNLRHVCTTCTKPTAFVRAAALRSHVKAKHTPHPHPPPANPAQPTPPVNPPATAIPAHPTPHPRHVCTLCSPRKKFATADALRNHTAAKHKPRSTPARSARSERSRRRTNPPPYEWNRVGGNDNYAALDSDFDFDRGGNFECIGGCANVMCKHCR